MKPLTGHDTGNDEDEMNRILAREEEIVPSSGFTVSVMDAVRREALVPAPIPFPWKRALPGLVAACVAVAAVLVGAVIGIAHSGGVLAPLHIPSTSVVSLGLQETMKSAVSWTILVLLATFVSVKLSMRLASPEA